MKRLRIYLICIRYEYECVCARWLRLNVWVCLCMNKLDMFTTAICLTFRVNMSMYIWSTPTCFHLSYFIPLPLSTPKKALKSINSVLLYCFCFCFSQTWIRFGAVRASIADGKYEAQGIEAINWTLFEVKSTDDRLQQNANPITGESNGLVNHAINLWTGAPKPTCRNCKIYSDAEKSIAHFIHGVANAIL